MYLMTGDHVIWCDWYITTWSGCPNSSSKNRKKGSLKRNENEKKMKLIYESTTFSFDTWFLGLYGSDIQE